MTYREHAIASVHGGTGRWLLNTDEYRDWAPGTRIEQNDNQNDWKHRMLWIIGNAGAGKSALMKMAVRHAQSTYDDCLIFPHFFNARGTALEKSAEGMYRTLIYWLLEELPSATTKRLRRKLRLPTPINWTTPLLAELLQAAVHELPDKPVLFFVDALDECDENEVYAMLSVFQDLVRRSPSQQVRVFFASRPHPHFGFDGATYLNLGSQEEHNRDIDTFVHEKLRIGVSPLAQEVKREVKGKAQGIFMWVVLVVQTLNSDFNHGNVAKLQQRLREIPSGLHELFRYTILDRYTADRDALLVCFQWLLFGKGPFEVETLWWAIQRGLGRDDKSICQDHDMMETSDMKLWIISISKGLVDFTINRFSQRRTAQLIHESVRDFLFKETNVLSLYGAQDASDLGARSHEQLRDSCLAEMNARRPEVLELTYKQGSARMLKKHELGWQFGDQAVRFPFAHYAHSNVLIHANSAQEGGHDQTSFLEMFTQQTGPDFAYIGPDSGSFVDLSRRLIDVLLNLDCGALIRATQTRIAQNARESGEAFGLGRDDFGLCPVWEAVSAGREEPINALVQIYLQLDCDKRHSELHSTLQQLAERWKDEVHLFEDPGSAGGCALLEVAALNPILATFFLIVLASPETLVPHLDELSHFTRASNESMVAFLQVLDLFFRHKLHSVAIDSADPSSIDWLVWLETTEAYHDSEEDSEEDERLWIDIQDPEDEHTILLLCRQLEESVRALLPADHMAQPEESRRRSHSNWQTVLNDPED